MDRPLGLDGSGAIGLIVRPHTNDFGAGCLASTRMWRALHSGIEILVRTRLRLSARLPTRAVSCLLVPRRRKSKGEDRRRGKGRGTGRKKREEGEREGDRRGRLKAKGSRRKPPSHRAEKARCRLHRHRHRDHRRRRRRRRRELAKDSPSRPPGGPTRWTFSASPRGP